MKTIKVERTHQKTIEYEKDGQNKSFIKYAVAAKDVWYELKGFGKDQVKKGDTITGEYAEQDWESNGKSGTNHILTLVDKTTADILRRLDDLEHSVATLLSSGTNAVYNATDNKDKEEDNSELPF